MQLSIMTAETTVNDENCKQLLLTVFLYTYMSKKMNSKVLKSMQSSFSYTEVKIYLCLKVAYFRGKKK